MVEYKTRTLPNGNVIKYRTSPPRDESGKPKPTAKQTKARAAASKRMKAAAAMAKIENPAALPGTPEYGRLMSNYLTKNETEAGKKKSRIPKRRAKICRKDGKLARCANVVSR